MTREEAEARSAQLNAEHPDRATHHWRAAESAGEWNVVKIALPATGTPDSQAETRADQRPPSGDDPRTSHDRNVGGPWMGGI